jgi:hypothetical protein
MEGNPSARVRSLGVQSAIFCGLALLVSTTPWFASIVYRSFGSGTSGSGGIFYVAVLGGVALCLVMATFAFLRALQMPLASIVGSRGKAPGHWVAVLFATGTAIGIPTLTTYYLGEFPSLSWYLVFGLFLPAGFAAATQFVLLWYTPAPTLYRRIDVVLRVMSTSGVVTLPFFVLSFWYQHTNYQLLAVVLVVGAILVLGAGISELLFARLHRVPPVGGWAAGRHPLT